MGSSEDEMQGNLFLVDISSFKKVIVLTSATSKQE
jgi:hypothetical protein